MFDDFKKFTQTSWMWLEILHKLGDAKDSFSIEQLSLLKEIFQDLDSYVPELSDRLVHFLKAGEDREVFEITHKVPVEILWLGHPPPERSYGRHYKIGPRKAFLQSFKTTDIVLLARFAAVIEALQGMRLDVPRDGDGWKYRFVSELFWIQGNPGVASQIMCQSIEALFVAGGEPPHSLVKLLIIPDKDSPTIDGKSVIPVIAGFAESYKKWSGVILKELQGEKEPWRFYQSFDVIASLSIPPEPEPLVDLALGSIKNSRTAAALKVVIKFPEACLPSVLNKLNSGRPSQRENAAELIKLIDKPNAKAHLEKQLQLEKTSSVRESLQRVLQSLHNIGPEFVIQPLKISEDPNALLTLQQKELVRELISKKQSERDQYRESYRIISYDELVSFLEGKSDALKELEKDDPDFRSNHLRLFNLHDPLIDCPDTTPFQFFRLMWLADTNSLWGFRYLHQYQTDRKQIKPRELAYYAESVGVNEDICLSFIMRDPLRGSEPDYWEFFIERKEKCLSMLLPSMDQGDFWSKSDRLELLAVIVHLPSIPHDWLEPIWDLALQGTIRERPLAQEALQKIPGFTGNLICRVKTGESAARLEAVNWIVKGNYQEASQTLEECLKKEKIEVVKGALFDAIESLGGSIEAYLDRSKLELEAKAGLRKGIPKELDWIPWNVMPTLHWADTKAIVAPEIIQWFLAQSIKLKQPSIVIKRHLAQIDRDEGKILAHLILDHWLGLHEENAYTRAEAEVKAREETQKELDRWILMSNKPDQNRSQYEAVVQRGRSNFELNVKNRVTHLMNKVSGRDIATKGVLQIVGLFVGPEVLPQVREYLKKWYGYRVHHCKALLGMISLTEHPIAMQFLLSVRSRFRTKSIQEEADRLVEELAARKGWTLDELADRTIPYAGFDEHGKLPLSYGSRLFIATLVNESKIVLTDSSGRELKALPEPVRADDPKLAAEAKKELSNCRKELKSVLEIQVQRLYEAMCSDRIWPFGDWERFLIGHPIMGRLCKTLVWGEVVDGKLGRLFRPLGDTSYSDEKDGEVKLAPETPIKLVHYSLVPPETANAWIAHFNDYNVIPVLQQFGGSSFDLTTEQGEQTELNTYEGYAIEAFKLRSRLSKLGFERGETGDGGRFNRYEKRLMGLGIKAVIYFTGNRLPEENRVVALRSLRFYRDSERGGVELRLKEVPKVFLAECAGAFSWAARDGTGFESDWENKFLNY